MSSTRHAMLAFLAVLAASLCDWVVGELFMRRGPASEVVGALALNGVIVIGGMAVALLLLPRRAFDIALRILVIGGFATLLMSGLRTSIPSFAWSSMPMARIAAVVIALVGATWLAIRMSDSVAERSMRAIVAASVAFTAAPFVWRASSGTEYAWLAPPKAASIGVPAEVSQAATLFLLLDETSATAAQPLADALREAGMSVRYDSLPPAGENTMNAIPAMFTALDFSRARPCGRSSLCSGTNHLDFSRIQAGRPDVHVTGILFPYCDIRGLRSCYQQPLPHEYGSAYRSLCAFWLRRVGLALPAVLQVPADKHRVTKRELLAQQIAFINQSTFWSEGGVMVAHLPLPHPPGMDATTNLDADYAGNLEEARRLVRGWADRARNSFGDGAVIVIASDHPLRKYWCAAAIYPADQCKTRAAFNADTVPWIVALPPSSATSAPAINHNRDAFRALAALAARTLH